MATGTSIGIAGRGLWVAAATAVLILTAAPAGAAPKRTAATDPMLGAQWAISDPAALGVPAAWRRSRGAGVVVAVIDSGVQVDHPDLAGRLWTNPGEVAGNGIDDDANGFVDDVNGANVISADGAIADDDGHGTHVAGIIGARAGNRRGGTGVAPAARIMPVKIFDRSHGATSSVLSRAIRYAVDGGAHILNVSLNGDRDSAELSAAIAYAGAAGATIVASAGNDGRDIDRVASYPASSTDPAILTVTASDRRGALMPLGNRGAGSVDLAAPGAAILSTALDGRYERRSGTSMAAPHVAASLALLSGARPDLGQPALRDALRASASPLRGVGAGRMNVGVAAQTLASRTTPRAARSAR